LDGIGGGGGPNPSWVSPCARMKSLRRGSADGRRRGRRTAEGAARARMRGYRRIGARRRRTGETTRAAARDGLGLEVKENPHRTVMTDGTHASE
jgi:hypothetical protein